MMIILIILIILIIKYDDDNMLQVYSSLHGPQLIGIVSNGAESCMGGLPGIFTRVIENDNDDDCINFLA